MHSRIRDFLVLAILSLSAKVSIASDSPVYLAEEQQLVIPVVDADNQPGIFQNVVIEFAQGDLWRLVDYWDAIEIQNFNSIEIVKTDTFPVQLFLRVKGIFRNGCEKFGQTSEIWEGNDLSIYSYYERIPKNVACTQSITEFSQIIDLPIYGLDAGTYGVSLNGNSIGTFTLDESNHLD